MRHITVIALIPQIYWPECRDAGMPNTRNTEYCFVCKGPNAESPDSESYLFQRAIYLQPAGYAVQKSAPMNADYMQ